MFNFRNRFTLAIFALTIALIQPTVIAQESDAETALDDFIHYALIANVEFTDAYALALVRDAMSNEDFYKMVIATKERHQRFDRAIGWALFIEDLEPLASMLEDKFEAGRVSVIRNAENLAESIELLNGSTRQRILADERLQEAGEYAVPLLLRQLQNGSDVRGVKNAREMLTRLGRDAVLPLSSALPNVDAETKVLVAKILGEIGYKHAAPALLICANNENNASDVRTSAQAALGMLGVSTQASNLSALQTVVANRFYDGETSLQPQPIGGLNLFWEWDAGNQLVALDVPSEAFFDVMAMYFASKALSADADNAAAMGTFVGANLRRNRALAGRDDLVYGDLAYSPEFYATVFGPRIAQLVLTSSMNDSDTPLVLDSIAALSETAGAEALLGTSSQPIVVAMNYPDRRVQYEAALTLASTLPEDSFEGSYRVVPLLASAIRQQGESFAIVVGDDADARREIRAFLSANNWTVVGEGTSVDEAITSAGAVAGIDLLVGLTRSVEHGQIITEQASLLPNTMVTPVFLLAEGTDEQVLSNMLDGNSMVAVTHLDKSDSTRLAIIEDLISLAAGGRLSFEEQSAFSTRALAVLRDIALADSVLRVEDATTPLVEALAIADADSKVVIAETLSMIDSAKAQGALVEAALASDSTETQVMLLDESASSVRRWGNLTGDWQLARVVDLAENSSGSLADAAARLNGALNLPNTSVMIFLP
ncbi:MAG: hypothetical protein CMJ26_08450 [Phycisphaerae bacterium]|nr:hypothetical protein [Phycisphaerae bacterium]|tara:strand:+ start:4527 stop:6665 length:2139 start_codon:yes stop_codon:yes gene_type:complete